MGTLTATNPLLTRSVSDVLYDYSLSSAYRTAFTYEPSFALARTPDVWEIVRNDVSFSASFDRYCNNVTKPWHVEAPKKSKEEADQLYAGVVEEAIGQIYDFDTSRWVLAEASFLGRKYAFIESERRTLSLGGTDEMEWVVPTFIKDVDRRRFRWVPVHTQDGNVQRRTTKLSFYNTISGQWQDVRPDFRKCLIEYIWYNTEDRVGYGRGWLEPIYFAHYMKTNAIQKVADGLDRWAKGIWLVKLDGLRNSSVDKTNDALLAGAKTMIQTMRSDNIGVIENTDDIQVIESTGTGHEMGLSFADYWDNGVERLVNGSTRPAGLGGQKTGARAQSETEEDTSEAHYQPARDRIDAVINRDLIGWFISQPLNRQNIEKLGLSKAKRPVYHTRQEKKMTIPDVVASASLFLDRGMPLIEGEVYERCGGWGVPSDKDKTTQPTMTAGTPHDMMPGGKYFEKEKEQEKAESKTSKMYEETVAKFQEYKEKEQEMMSEQDKERVMHLEDELKQMRAQFFEMMNKPAPVVHAPAPSAAPFSVTWPESEKRLELDAKRNSMLMENQENIVKFMDSMTKQLEEFKRSIPAPIVNVNVPKGEAPVAKFQIDVPRQAPPNITVEDKSAGALGRIAEAVEGFFSWFKTKKPEKKSITITKDADGKITGGEVNSK